MNAEEAIKKAREDLSLLAQLSVERVVGVSRMDGQWVVSVEGLERKSIPETMDVLGRYDVFLDENGGLISFERKNLRYRGNTDIE
ncbi:MAG TPA: hypothetical protein DF698_05470 [Candidatus Atribacteria bacterium]|nr:hypothetical protein [Candidatus Atribacteria bacterium]